MSIKIAVTAIQWKVPLEQARLLMACPASWRTCEKPHVAHRRRPPVPESYQAAGGGSLLFRLLATTIFAGGVE